MFRQLIWFVTAALPLPALVLAAAACGASDIPVAVPAPGEPPVLFAAESAGVLYTATLEADKRVAVIAALPLDRVAEKRTYTVPVPALEYESFQRLRWRLGSGYAWLLPTVLTNGGLRRYPMYRIPRSELDKLLHGSNEASGSGLKDMWFPPGFAPLTRADDESGVKGQPIYGDFYPISTSAIRQFILQGSVLSVWDYRGNPDAKRPAESDRDLTPVADREHYFDWVRVVKLEAPFTESFHAFPQKGGFLLVTDSGALYSVAGISTGTPAIRRVDLGDEQIRVIVQTEGGSAIAATQTKRLDLSSAPKLSPLSHPHSSPTAAALELAKALK